MVLKNWDIQRLGNGTDCATVEIADDGVGESVEDSVPNWADNVAARVGVTVAR